VSVLIHHVDAFAGRPFQGSPAAVCVLDQARDEAWMQHVAAELNLPATAFLRREDGGYQLRWFTPNAELDLCGHATLASAHILWETQTVAEQDPVRFATASGVLSVTRSGEWIEMDFPATPAKPVSGPQGLEEALGAKPVYVGESRFDLMVEVDSEGTLRGLKPNLSRLAEWKVRGTIVTSPSDNPNFDFLSRFFAPAIGIPEDPVTGSAHCCLAPFWSQRLEKTELVAYQSSPRGGTVRMVDRGDRVSLLGTAVTVLRAELLAHQPETA
jgi:PhzF family phenazine biosynthesis protein